MHALQAARAAHGVRDADNQAYMHEIEGAPLLVRAVLRARTCQLCAPARPPLRRRLWCSARAACKRVPIYDTLVIVFLCVHYGLMAIGLAVAAAQRVAVRKKLRLRGCCGCMPGSFCSFAGDWCLLFWCLGCALCQVLAFDHTASDAQGHVHTAVLRKHCFPTHRLSWKAVCMF